MPIERHWERKKERREQGKALSLLIQHYRRITDMSSTQANTEAVF